MSILVTGFTGNTGQEVAKKLVSKGASIVCAVRNPEKAKSLFGADYNYVELDFTRHETFDTALERIERIFLIFPTETQFSDFHAFIRKAKEKNIRHIAYLSVKDVQFMPFIPHYKNEKEIIKCGITYTFLRAGYFMQNLNLFLLDEILHNDRIYVPAGGGKTSFTDMRDIAEIAARSLTEQESHFGKKYPLTGNQAIDFYEVARLMTSELGRPIQYSNPTTKEFKAYMLAKGITDIYHKITNEQPTGIKTYIEDYRETFMK
ncbi:SDR family oxidoreductase [Paenibacillus wynnii]|uniref:SDR family oxidoreductase n=1 Tax=Paenibacillus wynnii TaxID=268407 RepID=UPI00278EF73E|nr:SDR family oxidoreductase [Paenibacillus wynnii]MDQ0193355.1 uncharacterized protein YbjT (DUF2867 family) [Paenibacillus wynnii]